MAIHTLLIHRLAMSTAMLKIYLHLPMHNQPCYRHISASAVHIMLDYSQRGVYRYLAKGICAHDWMDFQEGESAEIIRKGRLRDSSREDLNKHSWLHPKNLHKLLRSLEDNVQAVQLLGSPSLLVCFCCTDCPCRPETSVVMICSLLFKAVVPMPEAFDQLLGNVCEVAWDATDSLQIPSALTDQARVVYCAPTLKLNRER